MNPAMLAATGNLIAAPFLRNTPPGPASEFYSALSPELLPDFQNIEQRGRDVEMFRRYADGDHPANMTMEMRRLLRATRPGSEFTDNYMDIVIQTFVDRLDLRTVDGEDEQSSSWSEEVLECNRIDALQTDVHEAAIRDGETFIMVSYDAVRGIRLTHELAYDGASGIIPIYESRDVGTMSAAMKVWKIAARVDGNPIIRFRCNIYYPDRIERWIYDPADKLRPFIDGDIMAVQEWRDALGQPLGVPLISFRNRGRFNQGVSEIKSAIPLQDVVNRVLHSTVMTVEFTGFQTRVAKGFEPPAEVMPGSWITITSDGVDVEAFKNAGVSVMPSGDAAQFLAVLEFATHEIGKITRTPAPEFTTSGNASGEALKQREIGLIGKVKRFMIKAGNAWEDVMSLAYAVQSVYGAPPPPCSQFSARWGDPEIRNDAVIVANAAAIRDALSLREFLRVVAPVFEFDESDIDRIIEEKQSEGLETIQQIGASLPAFGGYRAVENFTGVPTPVSTNQGGI